VACGSPGVPTPVTNASGVPEDRLPARIDGRRLTGESVEGMNRVCTYPGGATGGEQRAYRIGIGQRCPAIFPSSDPNFPMPPSARLQESSILDGERQCIYTQGFHRWAVEVPLTQSCPNYAGGLESGTSDQASINAEP
jgi:hypothetical protein